MFALDVYTFDSKMLITTTWVIFPLIQIGKSKTFEQSQYGSIHTLKPHTEMIILLMSYISASYFKYSSMK